MTETPPDNKPPCPAISGTFIGYTVETKKLAEDEWHQVPTVKCSEKEGAPYPSANEGVLQQIGLLGYEQAMTLAWGLKARLAADGILRAAYFFTKVRVMPYEIRYDIKAYRREVDSVEID